MNAVVRSARALAWLRWRMFLNAFKGTRRRDTLERMSRAASAIAPIILGVMFVPALLLSCAGALIGGWAVGQGVQATPEILLAVRLALGVATAVVLFVPAIRTARGSATHYVRLALLPVPRRVLHFADLLAGITDPWIALLVPAMILFPIGIGIAGRPLAGLVGLLAGVALLLAFLALTSSVSSLLALLYRDRRRGEIATLALLFALSSFGFLGMIVSHRIEDRAIRGPGERAEDRGSGRQTRSAPQGGEPEAPAEPPPPAPSGSGAGDEKSGTAAPADAPQSHREDDVTFPAVFSLLPSEMFARALFEPVRGRFGFGLLGLAGVAGIGGLLYGLSWTAYRRLLDSPENLSPRRGTRAEPSTWRIPGLGPAASAVARTQVRLVLRTVQGKMAIYFTPVSLVLMGIAFRGMGQRHEGAFAAAGAAASPMGPLLLYAGATFALLSTQRFLLNMFAVDGAGLTLAFLSPISERELVVGKSAGMAILGTIPIGVITIVVAIFNGTGPLALWFAALLASASTYLVLAPASALVSALFPKAADMNRLSSASNPNGIATLLGLMITGLSAGPPALVAVATWLATESPLAVLAAVLGYGVFAFGVSYLLTQGAARVLAARRENLALVAQRR